MSTTSCLNCPSLMGRVEAAKFFGIGEHEAAPMCARFGHLFGSPGSDDVLDDAAERLASGCPSIGKAVPKQAPKQLTASWFTPKPELLVSNGQAANSCLDCFNFDIGAGACAATGRIIFQGRRIQEAESCAFVDKSTTASLKTVDATPVFVGNATTFTSGGGSKQAKAQAATPKPKPNSKKKRESVPSSYDSDAPVSEEHKRQGIRAWYRHVTKRGKEYFLPIFRSDYFGDDAKLIPSTEADHGDPSTYIDHAGLLDEFAVSVYTKDLNLVVEGDPGTGKTEGVRWLAYRLNMPFRRLTYNEASEPEQFLGLYQFDPAKGTFLDEGHLPLGWVKPGFLLSDEPNLAPEAIMQAYRSMNDSSRVLNVYKEKYLRHDYCFHIMAMNPAWDFRNIGTKPLASADSRRLTFLWMPNPDKKALEEIITKQVTRSDGQAPDKELVKLIIKIGDDLRAMSAEGTLPDFWTVSQEIKVARLVDDFGLEGAYRRAYFSHIDPKDAEPALAAIKSHVPYGSDWA